MYQRTHIVVLDSRKPPTGCSYRKGIMLLYLRGAPQPLGPIAVTMAAMAIVTPKAGPKISLLYTIHNTLTSEYYKGDMKARNPYRSSFKGVIAMHSLTVDCGWYRILFIHRKMIPRKLSLYLELNKFAYIMCEMRFVLSGFDNKNAIPYINQISPIIRVPAPLSSI